LFFITTERLSTGSTLSQITPVSPTNNAAENALREPVILRKLIGTLRNERGMFVHETVLSLLATWSQQGRNPYDQLQRVVRDNEMFSPSQAVPEVASG
jgi:transposase